MLDLIWIISTFIVYGFEVGVMALIFVGLTTRRGRELLKRCIGLQRKRKLPSRSFSFREINMAFNEKLYFNEEKGDTYGL